MQDAGVDQESGVGVERIGNNRNNMAALTEDLHFTTLKR